MGTLLPQISPSLWEHKNCTVMT